MSFLSNTPSNSANNNVIGINNEWQTREQKKGKIKERLVKVDGSCPASAPAPGASI